MLANTWAPMFFLPYTTAIVNPIYAVLALTAECAVFLFVVRSDPRKGTGLQWFKANLFSTFVGVPATWVTDILFQSGTPDLVRQIGLISVPIVHLLASTLLESMVLRNAKDRTWRRLNTAVICGNLTSYAILGFAFYFMVTKYR